MKYFIDYNIEYSYFYLHFSNEVKLKDFQAALYELMDDRRWKPGIKLLCDLSECIINTEEFSHNHGILVDFYLLHDKMKTKKMAILINKTLQSNFENKMEEMNNRNSPVHIEIFTEYKFSLLWLLLD